MKIVLVCGHPGSGGELVHAAAVAMGLVAVPSMPPPLALDPSPQGLDALRAWLNALAPTTSVVCGCDFRPGLVEQWLAADARVVALLVYAPPAWATWDPARAAPASEGLPSDWVPVHAAMLRLAATLGDRGLLLNALAAVYAPDAVASNLSRALALPLNWPAGAPPVDRSSRPTVHVVLAQAGLPSFSEADAVYLELESMATLDTAPLMLERREREEALEAWQRLEHVASQRAADLSRVEAAMAQFQVAADSSSKLLAQSQRELAVVKAEGQSLLHRLHEAQEQLEASLLAAQNAQRDAAAALSAEREAQARRMAEAEADKALRERTISELQAKLNAAASDPTPAVQARALKELTLENELQAMQLHQLQEELEHHYLMNRDLDATMLRVGREHDLLRRTWLANQPPDVLVDLRQPIDGSNWYDVEEDGRWMGPLTLSSIRLPALRPGSYVVQLEVMGSIAQEVLEGVELSLNGQGIPLEPIAGEAPILVLGPIDLPATDATHWELDVRVPQVYPPSRFGLPDERPLGLRVRGVTFTRLAD